VFSSVNVTPQTLAAFTKISRELIQDSPLAEQALRQAFSESLGLEVDRAAMFGSGSTPEPTGITNVSGVPSTSVSATLTVDHVMNQYHRLLANNVPRDNIAVIMPARAWEVLQNDTFSDGRYKLSPGNAPGDWDRITKIVSNQVPVSSGSPDTTQLVAGDFRNLVVAVRRMLEIDLSREGGALQSYQAWSLAAMRADIAVVLPNAFDVSTDVQLS
jgi:HK97 family phage major capsid protein